MHDRSDGAGGGTSAPELSVLVPSHRRPLRLRWLLNALEEQTLDRELFEVVVAHDAWDEEIDGMLHSHPLTAAGVLRPLASDTKSPAVKRNAGWRAARAQTVVFTDDDCRPPAGWLEGVLRATRANPGAVVQGPTVPDPDEQLVDRTSPHPFTQRFEEAPTLMGETCNIAYPRELLQRLGGFDETVEVPAAEDTDLLWRALKSGADHVGAPEMLTYHAVIDHSLVGLLRTLPRWEILAWLVRVHPELRRQFPLRFFWKASHPGFLLGLAGLILAAVRREPWWALLALAWLKTNPPYRGRDYGLMRMVASLPGRALIDAAEIAVMAGGSIRHRTLLL